MTQRLHFTLSELALFRGTDEQQLQAIALDAQLVRFGAGEAILRAGDKAEQCYVIRHGRVGIELAMPGRGSVSVQTIGEGEVLGWSWLFEPYHWQFDARALEPTRAVALNAPRLRAAMEADAAFGYVLMQRMAQVLAHRLQSARIQLLDAYGILT